MTLLRNSIFAALALALSCCSWAAAKPAQEEWVFHHTSPQFGRAVIYVCHDAMRIVNDRYGFEIVAKAPDWKLHSFRRPEKIVYLSDSFYIQSAVPLGGNLPKPGTYVFDREQVWKGLRCKRFLESNGAMTLTTADVHTDGHVSLVFCGYYNIPKFSEFPVCNFWNRSKVVNYSRKDWSASDQYKDVVDSSTFKFVTSNWEKVPYKPDDFAIPPNYRVTKDMKQIVLGQNDHQLVDMINNLGFTSEATEKAAAKSKAASKNSPAAK